jgi:hypothetical protein
MSVIEIDYMESCDTDANAQAAYVSNAIFDSYTKIASHFDGTDAAVAYTDPIAGAYTFVGTAQLDTAQKKFGTASLLLDGNSDYVTLPDSDNWSFGSGNFTVDFWVRFASVDQDQVFVSQYADGSNAWWVKFYDVLHLLQLEFKIGGVVKGGYNVAFNPSVNTWYHIACVRNGTVGLIFIDGVSQTITGSDAAFNTNDVGNVASVLNIGGGGGLQYCNGWIEEVRISKGIARWTSDFTPDTAEYPQQSGYVLQSYSESTIKTQGSYALKAVAAITDSLNKTITKTFDPALDLSGKNTWVFDIRGSRTGENIKLGLHDSGGVTTEVTPNILHSDGDFLRVQVDISGVSDANKNAIDSLIITIVNADA